MQSVPCLSVAGAFGPAGADRQNMQAASKRRGLSRGCGLRAKSESVFLLCLPCQEKHAWAEHGKSHSDRADWCGWG